MQLIASRQLTHTKSSSKLALTTSDGSAWGGWDRYLSLGDERLFHIGNVCDTCEFFFRRVADRALPSFEIERVRSQLECGLDDLDATALAFTEFIPDGEYVVALFTARPRLSGSDDTPDYFSHEQARTWPEYDHDVLPAMGYYRDASTAIRKDEMLFEFFVPLYEPSLLDSQRVTHYEQLLISGTRPTAVALSVLDVKGPASFPEDEEGNEIEPKFGRHWCLANYLLDGHHKVFAAHVTGAPITVLSFLSVDHSWTMIDELIAHYRGDR